MSGIDMSKLDAFIIKNGNIKDSVKSSSSNFAATLNEINDCCDGKLLDSIIFKLCSQIENINDIMPVLESYLSLLTTVRKNYVAQDIVFSHYVNKL